MSEGKVIWKRIDYERDKAYALFCIYRNDGPTRSLPKVRASWRESEGEDISIKQLETYSSKYNWVERASAFDDYEDEKRLEERWKEIEEMNNRQAEDAIKIQEEAMSELTAKKLPLADTKSSPEARRNAAARTWEIGVRNERLARGAATDKIEQSGKIKQEHSGRVEQEVSVTDVIKDPHDRATLTEIAARSRAGQIESSGSGNGNNS
ncbi:hypothetical protein [Methanobacterium sp.]|uniref:hypothetical protein n=1 Tax=Methanobacterium sp. TaxID=2164 RepID=UPI003C78748E